MNSPREELESQLNMATSADMTEMVTYMIFGSIVATTKAFGKVLIRIDPDTRRVFAAIHLRWWARIQKLERLRQFWIKKAEKNVQPYVPVGWRILVYYSKEP